MNIDGVAMAVKKLWRPVFPEEVFLVEFKTVTDIGFKF
jgi:hypothetical protein